jgi:hypothetical protein
MEIRYGQGREMASTAETVDQVKKFKVQRSKFIADFLESAVQGWKREVGGAALSRATGWNIPHEGAFLYPDHIGN